MVIIFAQNPSHESFLLSCLVDDDNHILNTVVKFAASRSTYIDPGCVGGARECRDQGSVTEFAAKWAKSGNGRRLELQT